MQMSYPVGPEFFSPRRRVMPFTVGVHPCPVSSLPFHPLLLESSTPPMYTRAMHMGVAKTTPIMSVKQT